MHNIDLMSTQEADMAAAEKRGEVASALESLVCALVDHPGSVEVRELMGSQSTVLEVSVARSDFGKLIGRKGCRAAAIRQVLIGMSGAHNRRYLLELIEPDHAQAASPVRPVADSNFDDPVASTSAMLEKVVRQLVDHPNAVKIQALPGTQTVVFEISVDPEDVPRLIGGKGRTASAIRELLVGVSGKVKRRLILDITEPPSRVAQQPRPQATRPRRTKRVWEPDTPTTQSPAAESVTDAAPTDGEHRAA